MRKLLIILLAFSSLQLVAQTSTPAAKKPMAKKPATATKLPPTAIIDTTAGKLTCVLFPDKAPIGVANFIGLARGTKDWTNPANGRKMHGVPLYNGTIFHRVIPNFMIQGGDPVGTGEGDPGYKFKNETSAGPAVRPPWATGLRQRRTRHQRLAVFHHRSCLPQFERRLHHLRAVR